MYVQVQKNEGAYWHVGDNGDGDGVDCTRLDFLERISGSERC